MPWWGYVILGVIFGFFALLAAAVVFDVPWMLWIPWPRVDLLFWAGMAVAGLMVVMVSMLQISRERHP